MTIGSPLGGSLDYGSFALDTVDRISRLRTRDEVLAEMRRVLDQFGYRYSVMSNMPRPFEPWKPHVLLIDLPNGWPQHYLDHDYERNDPVVRVAGSSTLPFDWCDVARPPKGDPGRVVMERADDFGMRHGLTIPVHGLDAGIACVSMSSPTRPYVDQHSKPALHLIAIYAFDRARELDLGTVQTPLLTPREREVLTWAANGRSSSAIADVLAITERTVVAHTANAMQKLAAKTRTEAVARALCHGLIRL